ncbi:hypothetical protein BGY98DRAFT_2322 [Russula aff. rugulosa BPL654]|nr:hypothetical protein BGY98DRAFT_2322 [Russula aff. rugulosa BPL654]
MSHARQPRYPVRTLLGVRKVTTFGYRVGVRGQCLSKCPTLRVQFVASYWPDAVYNVRRVRSDGSPFSGFSERGTTYCRFPPPHLRLYERLGQGEFGQVLNGVVSVPQSRVKRNVVAKLFLSAHLDKLFNEIRLYRTRLVELRNNNIVPKVFGAFVVRGSRAASTETMEKWGIIVMEKCGSAVQSVDELTVDQREAAYQSLWLIHQAGVEHRDFHLNNILFSSAGVRIIDFSEQ